MKRSAKVEHWDDERDAGNGIIVTLNWGWGFDRQEHVRGFDTVMEAKQGVRGAIRCDCAECQKHAPH